MAEILPAKEEHVAAIRCLLCCAFASTAEADLVEALRANGDAVVELVAEDACALAGDAMFCKLRLELDGAQRLSAVALAPLAVRVESRRQGIGHRLVTTELRLCAQTGREVAIVLGDPAYYGRFGFSTGSAAALACVYAGPALQAVELRPGILGHRGGRLTYPAAFAALD